MTGEIVTVIDKRAKIDAINHEHGPVCWRVREVADARDQLRPDARRRQGRPVARGWLPWLEANFDGAERTARVYMQLAAAPEINDRQSAADLPASMSAALKSISRPRPKPRPASPRDAIGMVGGLEDDDAPDPGGASVVVRERLDHARDRLIAETDTVWTDCMSVAAAGSSRCSPTRAISWSSRAIRV